MPPEEVEPSCYLHMDYQQSIDKIQCIVLSLIEQMPHLTPHPFHLYAWSSSQFKHVHPANVSSVNISHPLDYQIRCNIQLLYLPELALLI
jgi:hypothetical protein